MHRLIITAHPSDVGFTHKIAKTYLESSVKAGHTAEIMGLYRPEFSQDFLVFNNPKELRNSNLQRQKIQNLIQKAEQIIIVHPLWWGGMPAIMKNFLDQNITPGFAFKYEKHPWLPSWLVIMPRKLLKGKTAKVYITSDTPKWAYAALLFPFFITWIEILSFCGIKITKLRFFGSMRHRNEQNREYLLKLVAKDARAKSF